MNVLQRTLAVLPVAAFVTLCLLTLMAMLISSSDGDRLIGRTVSLPNILMPDVDIETRRLIDKPKKPKVLKEPEQIMPQQQLVQEKVDTSALSVMTPDQLTGKMDLSIGLGLQASDGEYLPMSKLAPEYPRRAARRGIEGFVVLEYTVTKQGGVKDIIVVESSPSNIFNSAAKRSAKGYKYKPRVENGDPVEVFGVRTKIVFRMEK